MTRPDKPPRRRRPAQPLDTADLARVRGGDEQPRYTATDDLWKWR